jgi:hypothetical protein
MPAEPPAAHVVHRLPGRLRLRVAAKRGDEAWFDEAATTLAMLPGVVHVAASPRTASVKLRHEGAPDAVLSAAADRGLFVLVEDDGAGEGSPAERLRAAAGGVWPSGSRASEGLAAVLALAALRQLWRGDILPPAVTLVAYAATVLATAERQSSSSDADAADSQPGDGAPPPT